MDEFRRKPVNRVTQPTVPPRSPLTPPQAVPTQQYTPTAPSSQSQPAVGNEQPPVISPQPIDHPTGRTPAPAKKSKKKVILWSIIGFVLLLLALAGATFMWYTSQLAAANTSSTDKKVVTIEAGSTPDRIAQLLDDEGLIRNQSVFLWYARIQGVQNKLQAGSYRLSPSETTPEIIDHLSNGKVDTFSITFLPGATLMDNKKVFISAGYSEQEVEAALSKTYTSPLFEGRPATADLEGYIYGETYSFGTDATVESILEHIFNHFYGVVKENDLIAKYAAQDLTLYEGITLASIVQREASPGGSDMPDIAQVFYNRLAEGMTLGSDVTYQYAADKAGVPRDTNLDSPYNTRIKTGLPPGPISAPGAKALIGTANPSGNSYLFFLSGDDDVTYYGRTVQEHEANIKNHCQEKCQIL